MFSLAEKPYRQILSPRGAGIALLGAVVLGMLLWLGSTGEAAARYERIDPEAGQREVMARTAPPPVTASGVRVAIEPVSDLDAEVATPVPAAGAIGVVRGRVQSLHGFHQADVRVRLGGVETRTNQNGSFTLQATVSDLTLLEVESPDHAPHCQLLRLHQSVLELSPIVLLPRSSLMIIVRGVPAESRDEVELALVPRIKDRATGADRAVTCYPWERLKPLSVPVDGVVELDDLPPCYLVVRATYRGATREHPEIRLDPRFTARAEIDFGNGLTAKKQ